MLTRPHGATHGSHLCSITCSLILLGAVLGTDAFAQEGVRPAVKPWTELEALDPPGAHIRRFAFTGRGVGGLEFPIPDSNNMFCTLNQQLNLLLNYYPARDAWVFQVQLNDSSRFAAGGIATCVDLSKVSSRRTEP